ncbi:MAG: hypothetical protein HOW97_12185 [Catenulispora sp.]|nr:hypothetical protein [Catenulispora sp.]
MRWLISSWPQVWPNLAANVLWVPLAAVHHWLTRREIRHLHQQHRKALAAALAERSTS